MKLSDAQQRFLETCHQHRARGYDMHHLTGRRDSGRACSAWYRTAEALERKGLVRLTRVGNGYRADLTNLGVSRLKEA